MLMNNRSQYNTVGGQTMLCAGAPSMPNLPMWVQANYLNFAVSGFSSVASVPRGYPMSIAYVPPQRAGGAVSRERTNLGVAGAVTGHLGVTRTAAATVAIAADAIGQLTASGVASGAVSVNGTVSIFAALSGVATAVVSIGGTADIQAVGFTVASGTISVNGAVVPYGIGFMVADSTEVSEFSAANLASAVWNATAASYNSANTMGEKLNDAGSAANPWTEVIESGYTATEVLRILLAYTAGAVTGGPSAPEFKSLDGTKTRIGGTADVDGNRTRSTLDGS